MPTKFDAGELGDAVEFFEWTSLYSIYQQNEHSLRLLEEKLGEPRWSVF